MPICGEESWAVPPMRVVVLGENRLFSEGLCKILSQEPWLLLARETASTACGQLIQSQHADVALVDCGMEGALELIPRIPRHEGRPRAIMIAARADDEFAIRALVAGARGVLSAQAGPADLLKAIRAVYEGEIWARNSVISQLLDNLLRASETGQNILPVMSGALSAREREIVALVAEGLANKEIADHLAISLATVKAHLTNIFHKLGAHTRVQVAAAFHHAPLSFGARKLKPAYTSFDRASIGTTTSNLRLQHGLQLNK